MLSNPANVLVLAAYFDIEAFHVCHSIPDAVGYAIRTPAGLIVHSGDFKFDYTPAWGNPPDFGKLAQLGGEGVLLAMSDSTNAAKPGFTPSEKTVTDGLDRAFAEAEGRVIIATFRFPDFAGSANFRCGGQTQALGCDRWP